jgi:hypothetical protein
MWDSSILTCEYVCRTKHLPTIGDAVGEACKRILKVCDLCVRYCVCVYVCDSVGEAYKRILKIRMMTVTCVCECVMLWGRPVRVFSRDV